MYRSILFALLTLCFFVTASAVCAEPNFKEGMWEMTMSATIAGMEGGMPPMQTRSCILKKDMSPDKFQSGEGCKTREVKVSGDTVTWKVSCKNEDGAFEGIGKVLYKGTSLEGTTHITGKDEDGEKIDMKTKISGKWTGPCK